MSRGRKISPDDILDAAERVVVRIGAAGLSIDLVAKEAGVSKSHVLYDHKSKSALLEALVNRRVQRDQIVVDDCIKDAVDTPHPQLFGRIASVSRRLDDADRAVAMAVSASSSSDDGLQTIMRDWTKTDLDAMVGGKKPEAALMSYLALSGFYCIELFDLHRWTDDERARLLDGIKRVYLSYPDA
ncbi:TetR/AcrR family transcriptional regulator [Rhizobium sp.]|uniref:TetR/AcrR family transcriptional regulator n=1 Tax=Rhizobium sp. TaxID=391 RepID=UPI0028ACCD61